MRIGYYIPGWPPDKVPNGIAATLERLSEALEKLGHEVYFLTPHFADDKVDPRVTIVKPKTDPGMLDRLRWKIDFERTLYYTTASTIRAQLLQLISNDRIEIFEMEESFGWVNAVAKELPIPVVTRLHGPWFTYAGISFPDTLRRRDRNRIEREGLAICSAFAVTAPSKAVIESTRDFYGKISGHCRVIPNPIPLPPEDKTWSYQESDKSTILFVGRFDDHKGGDIVLRAFSRLLKSKPNLQLNFVGPDIGVGAPNGKLIHFSDFIRNEIPAEVAARVNYLGKMPRSEIEALRRSAAVTVIASRYENFPGTVSEGMAMRTPLVATRVGGIPELLENERNALLIEPSNPGALASACLTLLDDPQLANRLAAQARIDCSDTYSPERIARQTVDFYAEVIEMFSRHKPRR
jgi:glycosyltransferase involved in cell wall biosynthesis